MDRDFILKRDTHEYYFGAHRSGVYIPFAALRPRIRAHF